jgi:hypothetical protein
VISHATLLEILAVVVVAMVITRLRGGSAGRRGHDPAAGRPPRRPPGRCRTGKVAFGSQAAADRVVHRSQTQRHDGYDHPLQRSYRCPHCGYWHTTSQRRRATW